MRSSRDQKLLRRSGTGLPPVNHAQAARVTFKQRRYLITLLVLTALWLNTINGLAQSAGGPYKITSSVVAGGGGASTGSGSKVIEGTTGQSAAGPASNGNISHVSGFWPATLGQSQVQSGQSTFQFSSAGYTVTEELGALAITVIRNGDVSGPASVDYSTADGTATQKSDFEYAVGRLNFAPGETSKPIILLFNEDMYLDAAENFQVVLSNPSGAILGQQSTTSLTITDDTPESQTNPIDDARSFVYMQYHDFLNREPDANGLAFWINEITSCGGNQQCVDERRVNVSAAFLLSIEFQQTGFLVHRAYRAAYGNIPGTPVPLRLTEFVSDTRSIGQGVVVNQAGWQQTLENNQQSYFTDFVQRQRFASAYPTTMTPAQFVDSIFANAGVNPNATERTAAVSEFGSAGNTNDLPARARALRRIADNPTLMQQEFNRAFVLMQYFGYLRRDPNVAPDADFSGYNFWLKKLDQYGNYSDAEMVKSFLISFEYRQRFGQ